MDDEARLAIESLSEEVRQLRDRLDREQTERAVLLLSTAVLLAGHAIDADDPDAVLASYRGSLEMFAARMATPHGRSADLYRYNVTRRIETLLEDAEGLLHHMRRVRLNSRPLA